MGRWPFVSISSAGQLQLLLKQIYGKITFNCKTYLERDNNYFQYEFVGKWPSISISTQKEMASTFSAYLWVVSHSFQHLFWRSKQLLLRQIYGEMNINFNAYLGGHGLSFQYLSGFWDDVAIYFNIYLKGDGHSISYLH